jgi:cilia- and flagella-associated protein 57
VLSTGKRKNNARHVFGLKASVGGNIHYVDESTVAYPAGANIVLYNSESSTQKFIHMSEKATGITSFTVSNNKKWMAIAETGKKPQIVIYELATMRKRKILSSPDPDTLVKLN